MLRRLLKIMLPAIVSILVACTYRYHTIRFITTVTVPAGATGNNALTTKVNRTAYIVYINSNGEVAKKNNEALQCIAQGDVNKAIALFESILETNEPALFNNYGVALLIKGDFERGHEYIYRAAILEPRNAYFRKNYLYLYEIKK